VEVERLLEVAPRDERRGAQVAQDGGDEERGEAARDPDLHEADAAVRGTNPRMTFRRKRKAYPPRGVEEIARFVLEHGGP
jgi:hypothetical protein